MSYKKKDPLVVEYVKTKNPALKEKIALSYKPLIHYIARKLMFNKDDLDDLIQVGSIALLRCLDRYSLEKGADFSTFATPNIIGEIKHYFRDKKKLVKVPRKLQELYSKVKYFIREQQKYNNKPNLAEIARKLDVSEENILEALEAGNNIKILSLDGPSYSSEFFNNMNPNQQTIIDKLGIEGSEEQTVNKETIKQALSKLNKRERRIIYLRFYGGLSQSEIAKRLNLSQMHISRLLIQIIKKLKKQLTYV